MDTTDTSPDRVGEAYGGDPPCWAHLVADVDTDPRLSRVVDIGAVSRRRGPGAVWHAAAGGDLDVNVVSLPMGEAIDEHRNDEVDVLVVVLSGDGSISIDGDVHEVSGQQLLLIPKGARRSIRAEQWGLVYLTVHRARGALSITARGDRAHCGAAGDQPSTPRSAQSP